FFHRTATAPPQSYLLSLHDALPILDVIYTIVPSHRLRTGFCILWSLQWYGEVLSRPRRASTLNGRLTRQSLCVFVASSLIAAGRDRKSTRLNSSHVSISYAVFCLKK